MIRDKNRQRAKDAGRLYYKSATACLKGHTAKRRTSTAVCTECEKGYIANYKKSPKYLKTRRAIAERYGLTISGRAYRIVLSARIRAKRYALEFNLTTKDIEKRLRLMKCEITGLDLVLARNGTTNYNPWAPSLDRKDPKKGYTKQNTRLVCVAYNVAKGEWSEDVLRTLVSALHKRFKE